MRKSAHFDILPFLCHENEVEVSLIRKTLIQSGACVKPKYDVELTGALEHRRFRCRCWHVLKHSLSYGRVWPCMAVYGLVWPCMALYSRVWPYMMFINLEWCLVALYGFSVCSIVALYRLFSRS